MFNKLLLSACVVGFFGCSKSPLKSVNFISENVSLYEPKDLIDLINQSKVSPVEAYNSVESLQNSFKNSYVGYNVKKTLIGKSGDEIFSECKENLIKNNKNLSSFELYDYVLQCLAGFKDTHVYLKKSIAPANVSSGISEAKMVDGKLYISRIRPGLITKFEELKNLSPGSLSEKVKVGVEIVSIDGKNPQAQINNLKKYISASSELALQSKTVYKLFSRDFAYPEKANIDLVLKNNENLVFEISLPWVQIEDVMNPISLEGRTILKERGIVNSADLNSDLKYIISKGVDLKVPLFNNLINKHTYEDEIEDEVLITGIANVKDKNYCYMQLNSFDFDPNTEFGFKILERIEDKTYPLGLPVVVANFLQTCEAFNSPLIFDLRNNGGGNAKVAELIFQIMDNSHSKNTYSAKASLNSVGNLSMIINTLNELDSPKVYLEDLLMLKVLKSAKQEQKQISDWVLLKNTSNTTNIFKQNIYLLTSPNCVSACESTTNRFKISGRAKIIGQATNGTGFGSSSFGVGETVFRDPLNFYTVNLPNHAFQSAVVEDDSKFDELKSIKGSILSSEKLNLLENNPTTPDIEIKYTLNDMLNNYSDYIESLSQILDPSPAVQ